MQIGQTRISSRRASTEFLHNQSNEAMIERGFNGDDPDARVVPGRQFYGIFFGDQDGVGRDFAERVPRVVEMVGQRQRVRREARRAQGREKTLRRTDARGRHDALWRLAGRAARCARRRELRERPAQGGIREMPGLAGLELEREGVRPVGQRALERIVDERGVAPPRERLAQRPGGQQKAVAAQPVIEDHQFDVARETVVLQAVVAHDYVDVAVRRAQCLRRRDAVGRDPDRHAGAARDQQRFVSAGAGGRVGRNRRGARHFRAVAARYDAGREAGGAQRFDERDHRGCLAGAAHGHVADHHDRRRHAHRFEPAGRIGRAARGAHGGEHGGKRRECPGERAALLPLAREACFGARLEIGNGTAHRRVRQAGLAYERYERHRRLTGRTDIGAVLQFEAGAGAKDKKRRWESKDGSLSCPLSRYIASRKSRREPGTLARVCGGRQAARPRDGVIPEAPARLADAWRVCG
ncbi:hypothetical protein PSAC2689_30425 [Paraburkholderia sacchari]